MELSAELQIQTVVKALNDVILPAVDPDNAIAREQGQLAVAMLQFVADRLPQTLAYARTELQEHVDLADRLLALDSLPDAAATARRALAASVEKGGGLLDRTGIEPGELEASARDIRAAISRLVDAASADETARAAVDRIVLAAAKPQLQRERAWLAPLGVEWDAEVPEIRELVEEPAERR